MYDYILLAMYANQRAQAEAQLNQLKETFIRANSYYKVTSKRVKKHIFKENEYYLTLYGLNTKESYEIKVTESAYEKSPINDIIRLENSKNQVPLQAFLKQNSISGVYIMESYDFQNNHYEKLYGVDTNTWDVYYIK